MDKQKIVEQIRQNLLGDKYVPWLDNDVVSAVLEGAGYFEIVKAAKNVIDSLEKLSFCESSNRQCYLKGNELYEALRKAGVWDE